MDRGLVRYVDDWVGGWLVLGGCVGGWVVSGTETFSAAHQGRFAVLVVGGRDEEVAQRRDVSQRVQHHLRFPGV